ncbi:unnamed protein product [Clonostachys rosea f. rosea IK726]|jgi:hypothetical protein|uniref:Uncharacterized protein n=2 Tax=Bionectria ochroleuca TaxID=29856 RepID=A0A8H7TUH5_BIOOC|nr:unnamed protein product [Clonostachys rosea f. rosea IK726]
MAAASASLRQKLFNLRPPALRSAFSTGSRCLKARRGFGARYIPEECKTFYFPDGRLWTTPENTQFLSRYGIEHDVALATVPAMDPEMRQVAQKFKATLSFSPRHIIDPFYVKYLDPRGHPLGASQKAKWARWSEERPLWLICSVNGGPKRVVRLRAMRRVRHALYTALEEKGYDKYGNRKGRRIKGTLRIHLNQPLEAVSIPSHEFGPPLVKLLEKLTSQTQIRRTAPNASRKTSRPRAW